MKKFWVNGSRRIGLGLKKLDLKKSFFTVIALLLVFYLFQIDWKIVYRQISGIGWWILGVFPITALAYLFGTLAWYFCLGADRGKVSLHKLFVVRHIGESLSIINPTSVIAGDGAKYALLRTEAIRSDVKFSSILMCRLLLVISAVILIAFSFLILIINAQAEKTLIWVIAIIGVTLITAWALWKLLVGEGMHVYSFIRRITISFRGYSWRNNMVRKLRKINQASVAFSQDHKVLGVSAFLFSMLHWIMGGVEIGYILYLLGFEAGMVKATVIEMGVTIIKNMGAFVPGQLGIEEYGNKTMIGLVGISAPMLWVSVSIIRRFRQAIWIGVGVLFYHFESKQVHGDLIYQS